MGSKHRLLGDGLGPLITREAADCGRFVDMFSGSGAVSWFAAEQTALPVLASDLQTYAVVLASAVVERTKAFDPDVVVQRWLRPAVREMKRSSIWRLGVDIWPSAGEVAAGISRAREFSANTSSVGPILNAYGGHYFSPAQAITLDFLLHNVPEDDLQSVCIAAAISAASKCAASPGHTAQPFQPTKRAARFLEEAWRRDPTVYAEKAVRALAHRFATKRGNALSGDATELAKGLRATDLVFVDPPYSGVHYSRFYHVLETVARRVPVEVNGVGRYPDIRLRPQSRFSRVGQSDAALSQLLENLSASGSKVLFTYPAGETSNGLSGSKVLQRANELFEVTETIAEGRFSTLGGNNRGRSARARSFELVLVLKPKG